MIIEATSLPEDKIIDADVCVVGAGVAGITLTRELMRKKKLEICLLESGGLEPDKATQSLYWGKNIGLPYYPLDTSRARFFGGTSHYWVIPLGEGRLGVRLRPLDPIDFEKRDWVPYSGWPFSKKDLDPYYERALPICGIGPNAFDVEDWENPEKTGRLPLDEQRIKTTMFQFGPRNLFFSDYLEEIRHARNVTAYLHANALEVETSEAAREVTGIKAATLKGNSFKVKARVYILALGGIETPRLLLLSNKVQSMGLGNHHDLVGRFFMEHPHLWSGIYMPAGDHLFDTTALYRIHAVKGTVIMGKLALEENVLRKEKLLNFCTSIHSRLRPSPRFLPINSSGTESLNRIRSSLSRGERPQKAWKDLAEILKDFDGIAINFYRKLRRRKKIRLFRLNIMAEQAPNPESRVSLMNELDALGQHRAQLNWRISSQDMRSIIRSQEILREELRRSDLGELHLELKDDSPPPNLHGGWHHMGTTRMHLDPKQGVIDENCRVHDVSNLFIAGPSVFPTSGYANPVLTFVALTVRLADHLKSRFL